MTKEEKNKCEKVLDEAALSLDKADAKWEDYEDAKRGGHYDDEEISLRLSENYHGYAEGIYQALAILGYKSKKMIEIGERIGGK